MLFGKTGQENLVVRGARVVDSTEGVDAVLDVRVDAGVVAQLGTNLETNEHRVIDGEGLVLAPAFVDPHVHLRTPGREDEETIATGTAAAAAGGYCAILAMPNTEPVVDSAAVLGSLAEAAQAEAEVPVGFLAAITKGQDGAELTEMAELADAGASGFTDDGRPVVAPGLMRRALQYSSVTGRSLALHCEEPTLSKGGQMHEGAVSAELGFAGYPSVAESLMVGRDLALAAFEDQPVHLLHLSARESVEALSRAQVAGVRATGEVTPHHLCLTDEAVRSLDSNVKMNPPLRAEEDRQALIAGLRDDRRRRHRSRTSRSAREGGAVRGGALRRDRARNRFFRALHAPRRAGAPEARDAARAHVSRAGACLRTGRAADCGRRAGESRPARPQGEPARCRGRVPLPLGELVATRRDGKGPGAPDHGDREGRLRGMTAVAESYLDGTAEAYRDDVVAAIGTHVEVLASFVLGSGLVGGYRPGESDLDLVVVVGAPLRGEARRATIEQIAALELPGRRLELVVYVRGDQPPDFDLNLEVDADGVREAPDEADHWFVIDAGIAQERIPDWLDYFEPVPEERVRESVEQSLAWSAEWPDLEFARLNAARARHYLEHGEWLSKGDSA
jgi:amidohydrolase family protein